MNRNMAILALAAAIPGLAACGDRSGENAAIDQNDLQATQANVLSNDPGNMSSSAPVENMDEATSSEAPEAPRGEDAPQPEPDPHAGHDMNNMADMPHD